MGSVLLLSSSPFVPLLSADKVVVLDGISPFLVVIVSVFLSVSPSHDALLFGPVVFPSFFVPLVFKPFDCGHQRMHRSYIA